MKPYDFILWRRREFNHRFSRMLLYQHLRGLNIPLKKSLTTVLTRFLKIAYGDKIFHFQSEFFHFTFLDINLP